MKSINFGKYIQYSFWGNVDYPDNKTAMLARNKLAREMKKQGNKVRCWTLANQLSKYSGFGQPDGRSGNVYKLDVNTKD